MKKVFVSLFITICSFVTVFAQTSADGGSTPQEPKGELVFDKNSYNFGDINQGQSVSYAFKYKNTGKAPVIISNVLTTCGCTVPQWSKEPIAPGKTGEINATFNSTGKSGMQNKVITVQTNAGQYAVSIVGNVIVPAVPAPTPAPATK